MGQESSELPAAPDTGRRRWTRSALIGALVALPIHVWMLTAGSWDLFRWDRQSDLYDAQARALLDGTFAMDQRVLGIESFTRGDQQFMYFGPVPSLLRLPVVLFTRQFDGRLAALSMLLALAVTTWALLALGWRLRSRVRLDAPVSRFEAGAVGVTFFAILGGSSLVYASSRTWVYHEAILWGVGLTFASLAALVAWLDERDEAPYRQLLVASGFATLALLTRPSVAGGALAAIGLVAAWELLWRERRGSHRALAQNGAVIGGVLATPVVAYVIINVIKFRRLLGVPFDQQGFTLLDARRREMLDANGGTLFNIDFIPTNLFTYLRPDLVDPGATFPFVLPVRPSATIGSPFYDLIDFTSGLPITMPLLVVLAVAGGVWAVRRARSSEPAMALMIVGCVLGTVAVLAIGYLANRYQSDFLPLIVVAGLIGLPAVVGGIERSDVAGRREIAASVAIVLVGVGTVVNLGLGYSYQRVLSPSRTPASVANYVAQQQRVDDWFGDGALDDVQLLDALPLESDTGDIAIIGDCDAMYVSDGVQPRDTSLTHWRLAELSERAGSSSGTVTIDAGQELVELGTGPGAVTISFEPGDASGTVVLVATSADGTSASRGPDLPWQAGDTVAWRAFADPFVGRFEVYVGERLGIFGELRDQPGNIPEDVRSDQVGTRVCDTVRSHLDR